MNQVSYSHYQKSTRLITLVEIAGVAVLLLIFALIYLNYYDTTKPLLDNPRFAKIDYSSLEKEANALQVQSVGRAQASNVFVLTYHVITNGEPKDIYEISYEDFKQNMFKLKQLGYQTVSLNDLYLFLRGEKQLPDKSFVLTFDDGAKAAYYNADPILKALNYTATMFVITGSSLDGVNRVYYLNESELMQMQNSGRWELESHTDKSHFRLPINSNGEVGPALTNKLWLANESRIETENEYINRITLDLEKADFILENKFNKTVNSFALPFGDFGERGSNYPQAHDVLYNLTQEMYKLIFYQFKPTKDRDYRANYGDKKVDSYLVVRLSVDGFRTPERLLKEIEASRAVTLPYYESYSNNDKWARLSGEATFLNDSIILKNGTKNGIESMMAYLDGSYLWKDYVYSLQVKNSGADTVILLGRFKSYINYVGCVYSKNSVRILVVTNNVPRIITAPSLTNNTPLLAPNVKLSLAVKGQELTCLKDGVKIISQNIDDMPTYGGVGVRAEGFEKTDKTFKFGDITVQNN